MLDVTKKRFETLAGYPTIKAIERAFILLFPIIFIGSLTMLFQSYPLAGYQDFILEFQGGAISALLSLLYNGTFGSFSIYLVTVIAYCYAQSKTRESNQWLGGALTALSCFIVMTQFTDGFIVGDISARGSFTAIVCALISVKCYFGIIRKRRGKRQLYADGVDIAFNNSLSLLLPTFVTLLLFAITSLLISRMFNADSLQTLFIYAANALFASLGRSFVSGLLYIALSTLMWFFGLHGTNILEDVAQTHFIPAQAINQVLTFGESGAEILTRPFFNYFVTIGGCGATICLLIAILIFSKRKGNRTLAKVSLIPGIFNINELTVFGLPIILNPIMLLPFLVTPLVIFCISYFAMWIGWVPLPIMIVEWTTPPLLSGYLTTGSLRGTALQLVCIAVGVMIYAPFVHWLDKDKERSAKMQLNQLMILFQTAEATNTEINLVGSYGSNGEVAKVLALDLENALQKNEIQLHYQPQFDNHDRCIGAEALLRWHHPLYGMLYPPLIIQLAAETNQLMTLEKYIFTQVARELGSLKEGSYEFSKLSVNVSVSTLFEPEFTDFLRDLVATYDIEKGDICIEVTEQMALTAQSEIENCFQALKELGFLIALDDFSMGYTSLKYLQRGQFDIVKLDGNLVKSMLENARCKDIISSIVYLSKSLGFSIIAEYVETRSQQEELDHIGCVNYQGYLYSPAITLESYEALLKKVETEV